MFWSLKDIYFSILIIYQTTILYPVDKGKLTTLVNDNRRYMHLCWKSVKCHSLGQWLQKQLINMFGSPETDM